MAVTVYHRLTFYKQYYETREITEEGAFTVLDPDNTEAVNSPSDYGGSKLTVEVVQRIVFADSGGNILELRMDDLAGVMDSTRKTGLGAEVMDDANKEVLETIVPSGPSTVKAKWRVRYAPLTQVLVDKATFVLNLIDDQIKAEEP